MQAQKERWQQLCEQVVVEQDPIRLGGHPNPANDGHLKTGQRELIPGR